MAGRQKPGAGSGRARKQRDLVVVPELQVLVVRSDATTRESITPESRRRMYGNAPAERNNANRNRPNLGIKFPDSAALVPNMSHDTRFRVQIE